MNYDICFCTNHDCKLRKSCERNSDRIELGHRYTIAGFKPKKNGTCDHYIKLTKEEGK